MTDMDPIDLAWLAGILDGEGSIVMGYYAKGKHFAPHVVLTNTDAQLIAKVASLLDALGCRYQLRERNPVRLITGHIGKKIIWDINVQHFESIASLLNRVGPYLVSSKRGRAELMLRWVQSRIPKKQRGENFERAYSDEEREIARVLRGDK